MKPTQNILIDFTCSMVDVNGDVKYITLERLCDKAQCIDHLRQYAPFGFHSMRIVSRKVYNSVPLHLAS